MRPVSWGVSEPMENRQSELQEKNFKTRKSSVSSSLFCLEGSVSGTPKICLAYPFCGPDFVVPQSETSLAQALFR